MSVEYDNYLEQHRNNVYKAYDWIRYNLPNLLVGANGFYTQIEMAHDRSKNDREEYYAYDQYFYGGKRTKEIKENFNVAWLHHIHNNPHHWQHWVLINDDPKEGTVAIRMPYKYVIEMICDWWAFSCGKGNLYDIFDWYDQHKTCMILHNDTRELVEDILSGIKAKLNENDSKEL